MPNHTVLFKVLEAEHPGQNVIPKECGLVLLSIESCYGGWTDHKYMHNLTSSGYCIHCDKHMCTSIHIVLFSRLQYCGII